MKTRIIKKAYIGGYWFFPQYYVKPLFFGLIGNKWKFFREWGGCDTLGFDYGYVDVCFNKKSEAKKFIKNIHK